MFDNIIAFAFKWFCQRNTKINHSCVWVKNPNISTKLKGFNESKNQN